MGKVFFSVGMTLDGFIAPEGMDVDLLTYLREYHRADVRCDVCFF
jgi:hypothetical protein